MVRAQLTKGIQMAKKSGNHQWKQMANAKYTKVCKLCGMKMTARKVKTKVGRFGWRMEITYTDTKGKKTVVPRAHNHKTPGCPGEMKTKAKKAA